MTVGLRGDVHINTASECRNGGLRNFLRLGKFSDCPHHACEGLLNYVLTVSEVSDLPVGPLLRRLKTVKVFGKVHLLVEPQFHAAFQIIIGLG